MSHVYYSPKANRSLSCATVPILYPRSVPEVGEEDGVSISVSAEESEIRKVNERKASKEEVDALIREIEERKHHAPKSY